MTHEHSVRGLLHRATHHLPGVPAHVERPAGHQGTAVHGVAPALNHRRHHSPARAAWFMPAWQRRVAAFFGRER
jgi:hypothetical protein